MPFIDPIDNKDYPEAIATPMQVVAPEIRTNIVDTRYQPTNNLLTWIEGRAWKVDYYSQVLGADNQLSAQQMNMTGPIQQYRLIKGMEIKVTDALTHSQDAEQKSMELQGAANMYGCLVPNEGDMFIAEIGDGRLAVFQITTSTRKTAYKEAVYAVNYISVDYAVERRRADLLAKVTQTLVFHRDFLSYGQSPLISTADYDAINELTRFYNTSIQEYYTRFASREFMVLVVPGQVGPTYDHFIAKFMSKVVETSISRTAQKMLVLNCDSSLRMRQPSILDAIFEKDISKLDYGFKQVGLAYTNTFDWYPHLNGIYHSGIAETVFPLTTIEQGWDTGRDFGIGSENILIGQTTHYTNSIAVPSDEGISEVVIIKPVLIDNYYIFSEAFYNNDKPNMSVIELLVMDHLEGRPLSYELITTIARDSSDWMNMEKFHYLPILYSLMKFHLRSI